jgi:hypothetical protein
MSKEQEIQRFTEYFRSLGTPDPESWARSQVEEGKPQYARFLFLREAWKNVIGDGDTSWIEPQMQQAEDRPHDPGAGSGPALKRMLAAGASREDIAEVVRVMQFAVLAGLAYQLSDSDVVEYPTREMPRVNWTLFEVDDDGKPLHPIGGLHESVLAVDPTGREMRPKGTIRG